MRKTLKRLHLLIMGAVNLGVVLLLCISAYSYLFDPVKHPIWVCFNLGFIVFLIVDLFFLVYWLFLKQFRMILLPLTGFLICIPQIRAYIPMNNSADTTGAIKILSYNVMAFDTAERHGSFSENPIVNYIMDSEADIVCLQEASGVNHELDTLFARNYPYRESLSIGEGGNVLTCLSRFRILSCTQIPYESKANGSIAYELEIGNDTILLINNHFESNKLTKDDKSTYKSMIKEPQRDKIEDGSRLLIGKLGKACAIRGPQAVAVAEYIRNHPHRSVIACGDFNDTPLSYTHHVLSQTLQDAFIVAGKGFGVSYNQKGFTFRIDHIMTSYNWDIKSCKVDNSIDTSDHYPIFCYLKQR